MTFARYTFIKKGTKRINLFNIRNHKEREKDIKNTMTLRLEAGTTVTNDLKEATTTRFRSESPPTSTSRPLY